MLLFIFFGNFVIFTTAGCALQMVSTLEMLHCSQGQAALELKQCIYAACKLNLSLTLTLFSDPSL